MELLVTPDGRPFKRAFRYAVAGSRGDTFRAILLLTTETLDLEHGGGGSGYPVPLSGEIFTS
jgi:hypothetical protein